MRCLLLIVVTGVLLAGAGGAYAWDHQGQSLKSVSATFTATTVNDLRSSTCTSSDGGTYATSHAEYTGTATSSEPTLNGPLTIDADSLVNTTTGVGFVDGSLSIAGSSGAMSSRFDAVYSNGALTGFAAGRGNQQGGNPNAKLLANLNAAFSTTSGFTNGQLGGTSNGGGAVEVSQGDCRQTPPVQPEWLDVHGNVTAVSSTSITAAGVTCAVPASLSANVGTFNVGDAVFMECKVSGGTTTLDKISAGGDFHGRMVLHVDASNKLRTDFLKHFRKHLFAGLGLHH